MRLSEGALAVLNTPGNRVAAALAQLEPEVVEYDWRPPLRRALEALDKVPADTLENLADDDRDLIQSVADTAAKRLKQAKTLAAG